MAIDAVSSQSLLSSKQQESLAVHSQALETAVDLEAINPATDPAAYLGSVHSQVFRATVGLVLKPSLRGRSGSRDTEARWAMLAVAGNDAARALSTGYANCAGVAIAREMPKVEERSRVLGREILDFRINYRLTVLLGRVGQLAIPVSGEEESMWDRASRVFTDRGRPTPHTTTPKQSKAYKELTDKALQSSIAPNMTGSLVRNAIRLFRLNRELAGDNVMVPPVERLRLLISSLGMGDLELSTSDARRANELIGVAARFMVDASSVQDPRVQEQSAALAAEPSVQSFIFLSRYLRGVSLKEERTRLEWQQAQAVSRATSA